MTDSEALEAWLRNPNAVKLGSKMPNYDLTEDEIEALMAYLYSLNEHARATTERMIHGDRDDHRRGDERRSSGARRR